MPLVQTVGRLSKLKEVPGKKVTRLTAEIVDETGRLEVVWFKGLKWLKQTLKPGQTYLVFGKPTAFGSSVNMAHPELELMTSDVPQSKAAHLRPVYSTTEKLKKKGLDSRQLEKLVKACLQLTSSSILEMLPESILQSFRMVDRRVAFHQIHFPGSVDSQRKAEFRLKFEELFLLQLKILRTAQNRKVQFRSYPMPKVGDNFNRFFKEKLPFELTGAQKRVVKEVHHDMRAGYQMNRLLQGDVGSGKTLVALLCMLLAIDNGTQTALMAPTEILATQHYKGISDFLYGIGVRVELLTGSTPQSERRVIHEGLQNGEVHVLIGTHALLEDKVEFQKLGLAVIDEQHRFGVAQRAKLWRKGEFPPHILVMTATPIPRTLAMTLYGDLETSVLDELPPGRKPVQTSHYYEKNRLKVFGFLKKQIELGRQVYIVYPLIDESEKLDLQNLMQGYESISKAFPSPEYKVSVVHGKMKPDDKETEMQRFKKGETQIMVATTVIEVGVDVPNASVMVIENAERFGLSQLHQLRGRVGRGAEHSFCLLLTGYKLSSEARKRLDTMVATNDGFRIAEVDLEIRGPGDVSGTQQSGLPQLKIANLVTDQKVLSLAREAALTVLEEDSEFQKEENSVLKRLSETNAEARISWNIIS